MISYDPKKTNLIINGTAITGFADGAMIEAEYNCILTRYLAYSGIKKVFAG